MYHPWRHFRTVVSWDLVWANLPAAIAAETDFKSRTVTLDRGLLQAERRCTIAHELTHIERGPTLDHPWWEAREEAVVDRIAAGRLVTIDDLGEALAWADHHAEVAEELWVDVPTVQARLAGLTRDERHYLASRLAHRHHHHTEEDHHGAHP